MRAVGDQPAHPYKRAEEKNSVSFRFLSPPDRTNALAPPVKSLQNSSAHV